MTARSTESVRPVAITIAAATLILIASGFLPTSGLLALIGLVVCALLGISVSLLLRDNGAACQTESLQMLFSLAHDVEFSARHEEILADLLEMAEQRDPVYREYVLQRLSDVQSQTQSLAEGRIEFKTTESWRIAYEQLLRSPGLYQYRSVAHVETPHYWQDGPGWLSTQLNLELQDAGTLQIKRMAIIAEHLWPGTETHPVEPIHRWIDEQARHGIAVGLIRESTLKLEPQLIADIGIYGHRAVGRQLLDAAGRTTRFVLSFNEEEVSQAEQLWERLAVYALPYRKALDRRG